MIKKRIHILRKKFKKFNIDGYIIPKNDEFFSEYAVKDRLKIIYLLMEDTQFKLNNNQENNLK